MKRTLTTLVATIAVAAGLLIGAVSAQAYPNCAAMHRQFAHGVAISLRAARREHRKTGYPRAAVRPRIYRANRGLDADHDGVACEA